MCFNTFRDGFAPAAAFDVIDLDQKKTAAVQAAVAGLNSALLHEASDKSARAVIREDAKAIDGMVRFPEGKTFPWRVDHPAIALYDTFSQDGRLVPNHQEIRRRFKLFATYSMSYYLATIDRGRRFDPKDDGPRSNSIDKPRVGIENLVKA